MTFVAQWATKPLKASCKKGTHNPRVHYKNFFIDNHPNTTKLLQITTTAHKIKIKAQTKHYSEKKNY
jgi:hypothetical protein